MIHDSRFCEGAILYFTPFIFPDGDRPKPKYFLVLKVLDDVCLLASLPTSKDFVPTTVEKNHGCIERPDINFNCYYFNPNVVICNNGFAFPIETYVYGYRLQTFRLESLLLQEIIDETVIEECGILTEDEYAAIIRCLSNSHAVKRAYRKMLAVFLH
ncbi:MAG: hypothetical protein J6T03_05530 [Bacteroidales bacterium]|nr:hypothetical protein [Bacteroidales bacterium]